IAPANPTLSVGQTLEMTAILRDANGIILTGRGVSWSSSNPSVATINSSTGIVTAVASGTTTISAQSETKTGTTNVTVSVVPVARVDVTPTTVTLNPAQTSQLTATAFDAANNVLQRSVTWSSGNQSVATVSTTGLVTAVAAGSATITATAGGVSGSAVVTVANVPVASVTVTPSAPNMFPLDQLTLTATALDAGGNVITGRPTTWSSSNSLVASVNATSGLVTALIPGAATITATIDGVSGSATVTINLTPVASVTLSPTSASMLQGQQTGFIAVARDAQGNVISRPITWSTTSPTVFVNVTQSGIVTAIAPGSEGVVATAVGAGLGGTNVADTATVTVSLVPVASMTISPKPVGIVETQQQQLTVQLFDSIGGVLSPSGRTISWGSRDVPIATVTPGGGLVTGIAAGSTRIGVSTAGASGTVTDSVDVTVTAAVVTSLTVQPKPDAVYQGATRSLRAVVRNSLGAIVRNQPVTWVSRDPTKVTVSQVSGVPDSATYTGVSTATGSTYVVAEHSSGVRDSSLITVSPVPVSSVQITPSGAQSLQLPDSVTLTAQPKDSAGGNLTRTITWTSLDPSIATVTATGANTAKVNTLASGTATIQATAGGVNGTATITVTAVVHTIQFTAGRNFVVNGDTLHTTVVLRDTLNNVLTGKPITFVSSDNNVAAVSTSGLVTGGSTAGAVTITATAEGKSAQLALTGEAGIASVTVTGPAQSVSTDTLLSIGSGAKTYTVTVLDGANNPLSGRVLSVTNSDPTAMSVSPNTVTTNAQGQATVVATPGTNPQMVSTITFAIEARRGAIPPGTPGNNSSVSGSIRITVVP
ncbi:MAG: Ig-like domain-containing protein, partial [Gemmatimonadota bacterium]